jgi:hypothetical protein
MRSRSRKFLTVAATREQVAVGIHRQPDVRMSHAFLHDFWRQFEAAVFPPVNAPRREEVPESMQTGVVAVCWAGEVVATRFAVTAHLGPLDVAKAPSLTG